MSPAEAFSEFIASEVERTGFTEKQVRLFLKERFGKFNAGHLAEYRSFLTFKMKIEANKVVCPYHPEATTSYSSKWEGRDNPGWMCSEGGHTCYLKAKMDGILERRGMKANWSVLDGDIETLVRENTDKYSPLEVQ